MIGKHAQPRLAGLQRHFCVAACAVPPRGFEDCPEHIAKRSKFVPLTAAQLKRAKILKRSKRIWVMSLGNSWEAQRKTATRAAMVGAVILEIAVSTIIDGLSRQKIARRRILDAADRKLAVLIRHSPNHCPCP
jgi:hypothetical protein